MRPIAACAMVVVERTRVSQVTPESSGIPRAMVLRRMSCSPRRSGFLSPSPLRSLLLKNLTPASRRQDHTILPSASGALVRSTISVHRIPLRVRDVAQRPSVWSGMAGYRTDLHFRKTRIFLQMGLDRVVSDLPVGSDSVAQIAV